MQNSAYAANLANAEQKATIQKSLYRSIRDSIEEEYDKDFRLSMYFYNFLSGKFNRLPNYAFIDKVVALNNNDSGLISIGCGIAVYVTDASYEKKITIENTFPINKSNTRIDKISSDTYDTYVVDNHNSIKELDSLEFPIFEQNRISFLQKYLKQYQLNNINSASKKTK